MRVVFWSILVWQVASGARAEPAHNPSLLSSVLADEILAVKVTDVSWDKPGDQARVSGNLSVTLTAVLRGKKRVPGTAFKVKMWMFRHQAQGLNLRQDVGSPWPHLPLKKGDGLVLFLAKKVDGYDIWRSSVGDEKIIDIEPYTEPLVHDVALINQCLQAKDVGAAIWMILQKPKEIGEEFGAFVGDALFKRRLGSAEVQAKVIRLIGSDTISAPARWRMIRFLEFYVNHLQDQPLPADKVQPLVDLLVYNLLDPKAGNSRQGLTQMLYNLLVEQKLSGKVKIAKSDIGPMIKVIQPVADWISGGKEKVKELTEVLEKMEKR